MKTAPFPAELTRLVTPGRLPGVIHTGWQSPSNIALIKYWGKRPGQLPLYPSLSMTLQEAFTQTRVEATLQEPDGHPMIINDDPAHPFLGKLVPFLGWFTEQVPLLSHYRFSITTRNSFPHSTGIASSASGMSAFALCLLSIASEAGSIRLNDEQLAPLASFAARMGSGSACRSLFGGYTVWGETDLVPRSNDQEAIVITQRVHPLLTTLHDAILVISRQPKKLSSSKGHESMNRHPFAEARTGQARDHFSGILQAMKEGDLERIGSIAEAEALALHALLMSAPGGAVLLEPATLSVMNRIREARSSGLPVFFTLDAGPNVHLMYPEESKHQVEQFIEHELAPFCADGLWIGDRCGAGPGRIEGITLNAEFTA